MTSRTIQIMRADYLTSIREDPKTKEIMFDQLELHFNLAESAVSFQEDNLKSRATERIYRAAIEVWDAWEVNYLYEKTDGFRDLRMNGPLTIKLWFGKGYTGVLPNNVRAADINRTDDLQAWCNKLDYDDSKTGRIIIISVPKAFKTCTEWVGSLQDHQITLLNSLAQEVPKSAGERHQSPENLAFEI
ncbi:hypothetical protein Ct61P_15047 [Colletotrichum tofieldiae]|nr:hypothetical protein Ct61P_15047 [Colletotrichum tofieldiae]